MSEQYIRQLEDRLIVSNEVIKRIANFYHKNRWYADYKDLQTSRQQNVDVLKNKNSDNQREG